MAWTVPVTDRVGGELMTADDCNRITGNILYLSTSAILTADVGGDSILSDWLSVVLNALQDLCTSIGVTPSGLTEKWTSDNINLIESITLACYDRVAHLREQQALTVYAGERYSGQGDYYMGGF